MKERSSDVFQTTLDSDFKCNTMVLVVGTDSRIKHLAFRSQVFFLAGGSTHLEPAYLPITDVPESVCLGKYCRMSPLVFSFSPFSQEW